MLFGGCWPGLWVTNKDAASLPRFGYTLARCELVQVNLTNPLQRVRIENGTVCLWHVLDSPYESQQYVQADKESVCCLITLGHAKLESTERYEGIEVDDALELAEHTEI
jgi:hypothetical protein